MTEPLLVAVLCGLALCVILLLVLCFKSSGKESDAGVPRLEEALARSERCLREEQAAQRRELSDTAAQTRTDLIQELARMRADATSAAKSLRDEVRESTQAAANTLVLAVGELRAAQTARLDQFAESLAKASESSERRFTDMREAVDTRLKTIQQETTTQLDRLRHEAVESEKRSREEATAALKGVVDSLEKFAANSEGRIEALKLAVEQKLQCIQHDNSQQLDKMRQTRNCSPRSIRG
jgi:hypothetical protein